jgi:transcriptional regulator with XRE-family HTH domain
MRIEKRVIRNIRKLRELRLMSREQMAAELSLSISGYGRLERGEIDLTLGRMKRIADILNVHLTELLDFEPTAVLQKKKPVADKKEPLPEDERNQYYRERYISMLESELDRLRKELSELRKQMV